MTVVGIDYGKKHVGIAVSEEGIIARPYTTVSRVTALSCLYSMHTEKPFTHIIIGNVPGALAKDISAFGTKLQSDLSVPVTYWDESFSSKQAVQTMIAHGTRKKKRRQKEHAHAAAVILQSYLNQSKQ